MKKFILIILIILCLTGCTKQEITREFGGKMTIELNPGNKLEEITWKENDLWILTRPMKKNEKAEIHTFYESSEFHIFEGIITIIEQEKN